MGNQKSAIHSIIVESNKFTNEVNHVVISSDNQGNQDTDICKAHVFSYKTRVPFTAGRPRLLIEGR